MIFLDDNRFSTLEFFSSSPRLYMLNVYNINTIISILKDAVIIEKPSGKPEV